MVSITIGSAALWCTCGCGNINDRPACVPIVGTKQAKRLRFGHKPIASAKNSNGDRSCWHPNAKGSLTFTTLSLRHGEGSYATRWALVTSQGRELGAKWFGQGTPVLGGTSSVSMQPQSGWWWDVSLSGNSDGASLTGTLYRGIKESLDWGAMWGEGPISVTCSLNSSATQSVAVRIFQRWDHGRVVDRGITYINVSVAISSWANYAEDENLVNFYAFRLEVEVALKISLLMHEAEMQLLDHTSEAVIGALDKVRLHTSNGIAYARDTFDLVEAAKKAWQSLRTVRNPRQALRRAWRRFRRHSAENTATGAANAWLQYRYGLPLYCDDTLQIMEGIRKYNGSHPGINKATRSISIDSDSPNEYGVPYEGNVRAKIYYDRISIQERKLLQNLRYLDLLPSATNLWDLVPYSFVVDWLLPVGQVFAQFDAQNDTNILPIRGGCVSCKLRGTVEFPPFIGSVDVTAFMRKTYTQSSLSRAAWTNRLKFGDGLTSLKHGIDTIAMAWQRRRDIRQFIH